FGVMEGNRTGLAVGLMDGDVFSQPTLYYSSPSDYGNMNTGRKVRVRVVYQTGSAKLYVNDMTTPVKSFNVYLDGRHVTFFLYATSISGSTYNVKFDNFWTNQAEPGELMTEVENETRPFAADGSGGIMPGEIYKFIVRADPGLNTVQAGFVDPATMRMVLGPKSLRETTPGIYEFSSVMPSLGVAKIAAVGSNDRIVNNKAYSRNISHTVAAGRVAARTTSVSETVALPLPAFLLPMELR
ncbi:hypothetical protein ACFLQK_01830, partial [bacterium]